MTRRKTPRERYLRQFGLDLSLYSTGDGWRERADLRKEEK